MTAVSGWHAEAVANPEADADLGGAPLRPVVVASCGQRGWVLPVPEPPPLEAQSARATPGVRRTLLTRMPPPPPPPSTHTRMNADPVWRGSALPVLHRSGSAEH